MTGLVAICLTISWMGFMFIIVVFCDQIVVILNRISILERVRVDADRLKGGLVKKRGYQNFRLIFGDEFGISWFFPVRPRIEVCFEDLYK